VHRYVIGSGYFSGGKIDPREQAEMWVENTRRHFSPQHIFVVAQERTDFPVQSGISVITCPGNPGHVHNLLGIWQPMKPHAFGGWSSSILALAMIAYSSECDFIYKEGDCFAFGDCATAMYQASYGKGAVWGKYDRMPCAQSLFLVKHPTIPDFVRDYLSLGNDRDKHNLPEHKFSKMLMRWPSRYGQFSFGYDRARPNQGLSACHDSAWYVQQLDADEIAELKSCGRL
jgi:hypothetical protein